MEYLVINGISYIATSFFKNLLKANGHATVTFLAAMNMQSSPPDQTLLPQSSCSRPAALALAMTTPSPTTSWNTWAPGVGANASRGWRPQDFTLWPSLSRITFAEGHHDPLHLNTFDDFFSINLASSHFLHYIIAFFRSGWRTKKR